MQLFPLANANSSLIAVTGTATALKTLIDTAGATTHDFRPALDAVDIVVEDGDIRILYDNNTPTATKGIILRQGTMLCLRHVPISSIKLIRTGGANVACSVQIGTSESIENTSISVAASASSSVSITAIVPGTGATNLGKAEDAAHTSGDVGVMSLAVRNDADAALSGTDLDYTPLATDSAGAQKVVVKTNAFPALTTVACGELAGNAAATQMPSVACKLIKFKAEIDNAGNVYIGGSTVTKADGTTDTTTGLQLAAGEETPWMPVTNANIFYRICDNAGDDLTYIALS